MRVVTYNIVLGCDGRRIIPNFFHALAYILGSSRAVKYWSKHASKHLDFSLSFDPDILCINEVLPDIFGNIVEQKLREAGFKTIISGIVEHHPFPLRIATYLAVKWSGEQYEFANPYRKEVGAASGWCAMRVPENKLSILAVHAGLNPRMRKKQMEFLGKEVDKEQKAGRKVVVLGDFNASLKEIFQSSPILAKLQGTSLPTNCYLIYNWLKKIFADDIDHILWSHELIIVQANTHEDMSDHKLLLCDFMLK